MPRMGISGRVAKQFLDTEITLLLAILGLMLGLFAILVTPREEEPQIDVTFANVFIPFPGASVDKVEHLVATPAEQVLSEITGIEHVYSVSQQGMAVLTVQFEVGEAREDAIIRLYNKIFSNRDFLPPGLGVAEPIIKPMGIDDVPIVALTLWSEQPELGGRELLQVAHALEAELKRVKGTRDIYTIGGPDRVVHVLLDAQKLAAFNVSLDELRMALQSGNVSRDAGSLVRNNQVIPVKAGDFLLNPGQVGALVVGLHDGRPVYLADVASISESSDFPDSYVWYTSGDGAPEGNVVVGERAAVTIAVAKKPGTNAVDIAEQIIQRVEQLKGVFIPEGVNVSVTRDYGLTADAKAKKLIQKLVFATSAVVLLVLLALGWREAIIVGVAVFVTLALTLFASWAWGFTLNRVSLFALIFSIGILVDDAIVVVENIHRHLQMGAKSIKEAIPLAVDEVGGPTILATFAVIAALLPMAFVTGLMGPYMSPIPINASMGMLISLVVAFIITPWMSFHLLHRDAGHTTGGADKKPEVNRHAGLFNKILRPFLSPETGGRRRSWLFLGITGLIILSVSLVMIEAVVMKMLPFDNKSEFQVIVDMDEGTPLETTNQVLVELAEYLKTVPEVDNIQAYAGTAAPINFNGLVRQYYLRESPHVGDLQVNLVSEKQRGKQSHQIASEVRQPLQDIGRQFDANVKIVEVPPGPPVMSPLVAEVYGLDYQGQIEVARELRTLFENTAGVVDIDDSVEYPQLRYLINVDRNKAALLGVSQDAISSAITTVLRGEDIGYLHGDNAKYPVPIRLEFPVSKKADIEQVLALRLAAQDGSFIAIADIVSVVEEVVPNSVYHKDLLPVVFVTADLAGDFDSPLYGMFEMYAALNERDSHSDLPVIEQYLVNQPDNPYRYSMKWDGEWQITYETFRDMGLAYSIGLIMIFFLVVAQFRSYLVPLVIMAPIPLTIIGVLPGHALLGAKFTATSMIGMIALAGIIVRNSILLVDFINQQVREGMSLADAVVNSAVVRAKPIILTGLAAMLGAFFILDDPIFRGLAISLIFGILVSTVLTLLVIPVMYYALMKKSMVTGWSNGLR